MSRLRPLLAVVAMAVFGFGVYATLGSTKSRTVSHPNPPPPPSATPAAALPGTIYLVQSGTLYAFHGGAFTQLGQPGPWSQPAASPDGGRLVAVKRGPNVSDLYQLGLDGSVQKQLTHNSARIVEVNQWAFYPRFSLDGAQLFFSTDRPKVYDYRVDLAVWSMPSAGGAIRQWTAPEYYSGGDVQPAPAPGGGVLYTKYTVDDGGQSVSAVMFAAGPLQKPVALTDPGRRCSQPQPSRDGTQLAMICAGGTRATQLVVAPYADHQLGAPAVVVDGTLATSAAWAPDGSGLVYLAPGADDPGGGFQLWWAATGSAPRQVTRGLSFDGLSAPIWLAA